MRNDKIQLRADKLTCIREDRILFDELSFRLDSGDILQVEGANGTGKTSLLRILAGLSQPYSGRVFYNAEATLEQVNLYGFEDAKAGHLSAGQHRRIALARLWQTKARIWILDEPFTAIDKEGVKQLEALMLQHAQNGGCIVLTTHQDLSFSRDKFRKITLEYNDYGVS